LKDDTIEEKLKSIITIIFSLFWFMWWRWIWESKWKRNI
jgi:hypothetical protein